MIIEKVQRVANPTRKSRKYKAGNPRKPKGKVRVKLSAKQIKAGFGGKRRMANASHKHRKAGVTRRASNPRQQKKRVATTKPRHQARSSTKRRSHNPAIMALGYINPERTTTMSKTKKRRAGVRKASGKSYQRSYKLRSKNPRRHTRRHRSNPDFMGSGMEAVGILIGVAAQKLVNGFVPSTLTSGNQLMSAGVSFVVAFLIGKGADMALKGKPLGKGIALGALASAASTAINIFAPQLSGTIGLSGMGVYQNAIFAVPENPIMRGLPAPSVPVAAKGMGGALTAAFGHSF